MINVQNHAATGPEFGQGGGSSDPPEKMRNLGLRI